MSFEYDEKGKYFTDFIKKEARLTQIQTQTHRIEGYVHIRIDARLSDEINQDRLFLAVTNAQIFDLQGEFIGTSEFLAVNRAHIIWLMPVEDPREKPE